MKQLLAYMDRHHNELIKSLTVEQKKIFEKYDDCWGEYSSKAEEAMFCYAFKLGMQMSIDVLK